jgi:hypothetical protein
VSAAAWITAASGLISSALDLFDGGKKREAELLLKQVDQVHSAAMAQLEVNKIEASSSSLFVSGWRPAIGWTCAFAIFSDFCLRPLMVWASGWYPSIPIFPSLISDNLWELMAGMLGLSGLRTFEKTRKR